MACPVGPFLANDMLVSFVLRPADAAKTADMAAVADIKAIRQKTVKIYFLFLSKNISSRKNSFVISLFFKWPIIQIGHLGKNKKTVAIFRDI